MSGKFNMSDYVDVAQRIEEFYERFPDGSLRTGTPPQILEAGGKSFVVYHAQAYRSPEDSCPADGWAWEPIPGPTQFTKDSELMNAETAAWGRAIVACGFKTKKIASAQEVQARGSGGEPQAGENLPVSRNASAASHSDMAGSDSASPPEASFEQKAQITILMGELAKLRNVKMPVVREALENDYGDLNALDSVRADELIGKLERWKVAHLASTA